MKLKSEVNNFNCIFLILFSISITFLVSCEDSHFNGYYFNEENQQIFDFKDSELIIYNIKDSIKNEYVITLGRKNEMEINSENKKMKIYYRIDQNVLWLIDDERLISSNKEVKLVKFKFGNTSNPDLLATNYWYFRPKKSKVDYWIKYHILENNKYGLIYGREENSNDMFFESFFDIGQELYFDKFLIYKFDSYNWDPYGYLLVSITEDSLKFRGLRTFDKIELKNYKFKTNLQLYGTWVNVNSSKNHINLFGDNGRFYFGDTIVFQKNNKFKRKVKEYFNYFYKDTISKTDNVEKEGIGELEIPFEVGLNNKYLIFDRPLNQILKVEMITKDSLIIKNHTVGEKLVMKYVRVVD